MSFSKFVYLLFKIQKLGPRERVQELRDLFICGHFLVLYSALLLSLSKEPGTECANSITFLGLGFESTALLFAKSFPRSPLSLLSTTGEAKIKRKKKIDSLERIKKLVLE